MPAFISKSQATQLQKTVKRYKSQVNLGKPWNKWKDDALLRKVLGQVAVIGRAGPGERLQRDPKVAKKLSVKKLSSFKGPAKLQKYLHGQFEKLKIRYSFGSTWRNDWKARASAQNFQILMDAGGPTQFFKNVANLKKEKDRITELKKLKRYGDKSARDTLIDLRLAENCMALDIRIYGVLEKVGVNVSPAEIFKQVERELIKKVADPLGLSGALLDRILFGKYEEILERL